MPIIMPTGQEASVSWEKKIPDETMFVWRPRRLKSGGLIWMCRVYYNTSPIFVVGPLGLVFRPRDYYTEQEVLLMKLRG